MLDTSKMIFVFGSNLEGHHGKGAALFAKQHRGAIQGQGIGPMNQSYAIPTKGYWRNGRLSVLSWHTIRKYVDDFIEVARQCPEWDFQITCIGCGLAGYQHYQIAPMFIGAPENCYFDTNWKPWLDLPEHRYWGTI